LAKGPEAFRTISEAAGELSVPQHVLRFWETKFSFIRPMKRAGGRRFYRPQDILVLRGVRRLLHEDGYTIKGVQRLHREQGMQRLLAAASGLPASDIADTEAIVFFDDPNAGGVDRQRLEDVLADLENAKAQLDALLPES
jgi:DNA-binding transcriptional MerR regulator